MIIIGDIHGCYKTFRALLKKLPKDKIVLTGDLIDRGPDSYKVVQYAIDHNIDCVKGNHEDIMIHLYDANALDDGAWVPNGGAKTLESYKGKNMALHIDWMKNLPIYLEYDLPNIKLVVSHGLILNYWDIIRSKGLSSKIETEIMWGRDPLKLKPKGIYNIIGHTPQKDGPEINQSYSNIDTGCVFKKDSLGTLTAIQYPSLKIFQQKNIEDI